MDTYGPTRLLNILKSFSPVPIREIRPSIDRIKLVIRNNPYAFIKVKRFLYSTFDFKRTTRDEEKDETLWHFFSFSSLIILKKKPDRWFDLTLFYPTVRLQQYVKLGIEPLFEELEERHNPVINLSEVEFSYDVYPENENDLKELSRAIRKYIYLKNSRVNSFKIIGDTHYQGKDGNVRRGSGGLRMYDKEKLDEIPVRMEIILKNKRLKRKDLTFNSLPLAPYEINPLDYLSFQEPLTKERLDRVVNTIFRRRFPRGFPKTSGRGSSRAKVMRNIFRYKFLKDVLGDKFEDEHHTVSHDLEYPPMPVAEQSDNFKKVRKKWRLSYNAGQIFPRIKIKKEDE